MIPEDKSTITISKEIMEKYQVIIELMEQLVEGNIFKKELNSEIRNVIDEILINLPPI